jgi:hypothetical protein
MKQHVIRAGLGLLGFAAAAGLILILAGQFADVDAGAVRGVEPPLPLLPFPVLVTLLIALGVGALAFLIRLLVAVIREPAARKTLEPGTREIILLGVALFAGLLVIYFAMAFVMSFFEAPEEEQSGILEEGEPGEYKEEFLEERTPFEELTSPSEGTEAEDRPAWLALVLAAAAAIAAAVVTIRAYRRYAALPNPDETEALDRLSADLHSAGARGLERMLDEPDDRRAVIAAYALVEQTFERHGYPHESSQTPTEFVEAALGALEAKSGDPGTSHTYTVWRDALLTLTRLYEIAKFSDHPVGPHDRRRAVEAMSEIASSVSRRTGRRHER